MCLICWHQDFSHYRWRENQKIGTEGWFYIQAHPQNTQFLGK
jgi:hypothetical protein